MDSCHLRFSDTDTNPGEVVMLLAVQLLSDLNIHEWNNVEDPILMIIFFKFRFLDSLTVWLKTIFSFFLYFPILWKTYCVGFLYIAFSFNWHLFVISVVRIINYKKNWSRCEFCSHGETANPAQTWYNKIPSVAMAVLYNWSICCS